MWMGGFTFYAEVVIPTAAKVLGSERHVGFITQQVTGWLNWIGLVALAVFQWTLLAEWPGQRNRGRLLFGIAWGTMAAAHIGLFVTHPFIDKLLESSGHKIRDYDQFLTLHNIYLAFATTQWVAALLFLWLCLRAWRAPALERVLPQT